MFETCSQSRWIATTAVVLVAFVVGCQSSSGKRAAPTTPPPTPVTRPASTDQQAAVQRGTANAKALIDFTRGTGGFPLAADALPPTLDGFVASMTKAYMQRVDVAPNAASPVVVVGDQYPNLESLRIDLTGARVKPSFKPKSFSATTQPSEAMRVKHVEYIARPLQYIDGKTYLSIQADDVVLGLLRARPPRNAQPKNAEDDEAASLVMTEARNGRAQFDVAIADLRTMMRVSARSGTAGSNRSGYVAQRVDFAVSSDDPHSLTCEMRVGGRWLLLPTSFAFTGRVDVDEQFNAHLSNLSCHGTDVGGLLFAGFLDSMIKKYEGRVMPLASFPGGKIKVRDLTIRVDDAVHVDIAFSSPSPGQGEGWGEGRNSDARGEP